MSDFIKPLFTFRELARGVDDATRQEHNETQVMTRPRASSLMNDAREVAYTMAGVKPSDPPQKDDLRFDGVITAETGRVVEDLLVAGVGGLPLGLTVINRQIELPEEYPVSGHPDGQLARLISGDPSKGAAVWADKLDDGRRWGVEFKVKGNYQFLNLALDGIMSPIGRDLLAQVVLYGHALDWDAVLIFIIAADASAVRSNLRFGKYSSLASADPADFHPKGYLWALDLEDLKDALIPDLHKRAAWFAKRQAAGKDPAQVKFEQSPQEKGDFPWGWSEYYRLAQKDGDGTAKAPWPKLLKKGR